VQVPGHPTAHVFLNSQKHFNSIVNARLQVAAV